MASGAKRLSFDAGTLLLEGLGPSALEVAGSAIPWAWDPRVGAWRTDACHYVAACLDLGEAVGPEGDSVGRWRPVRWPKTSPSRLRPDQLEALGAWAAQRRGVVVMPTGTGKTEVALQIMADTAVSTLVVAPVRDLMYQWHRRILERLDYDAGIIGDNVFRVRSVSVTTYDSASIHMDKLGDRFALVVFDECHHLPGSVFRDAARMSASPMRLGLTATPERSDGREVDLEWLVGRTVYQMPISAARGKTLAEYEVVRIPVHLSPPEQARYDRLSRIVRSTLARHRKIDPGVTWRDLCTRSGATPEGRRAIKAYYAKKAIEDRAEEKLRVLEDLFRLHLSQPCLVFAGSNAMARDVSRRFLIPCLLSHCRKHERLEILRGVSGGTYPALVANRVLDEGVDLPEVKVAVVIGGTASSRQAKQRLGRILRKSGNARAVLYEVVCADTNEEQRSRRRRASDAYQKTRRWKPKERP